MGRRHLLYFWGFSLSVLAVFIVVGYLFGQRTVDNVKRSTRAEQRQVAERVVSNVTTSVERVQQTIQSILSHAEIPYMYPGDHISVHLRMLLEVYPEIKRPMFIREDGVVLFVDERGTLTPPGITLDDIYEGDELKRRLFRGEGAHDEHLHVTGTGLSRIDTGGDHVELLPVLLFYRHMTNNEGERGALVVPYPLDFLMERFIGALERDDETLLALLDGGGVTVYATREELSRTKVFPALADQALPWEDGRFTLLPHREPDRLDRHPHSGRPVYGAFDLTLPGRGEPERYMGWLAPLTLAEQRWTVVVTSPERAVTSTHWAIMLPFMLGAASLTVLIVAFAFASMRRIQRQMKISDQFRAAMEQSVTGLLIADREFRFLYANRAFYEATDTRPETLLGRSTADFSGHVENRAQLSQAREALSGGKTWQGDVRIRDRMGESAREFGVTSAPIIHQEQRIGYITSIRDITREVQSKNELERYANELARAKRELERDIAARKRAEREKTALERQLRRSQTLEAVGQLAGGVAHDFNNVLGSILACLYAIERAAGDERALAEELERTKELCKRGGELTRQLLAVGRRTVSHEGLIDMGPFLDSIGLLLERTLPRNITLTLDAESQLPLVRGDRSNLLTAFLNLGLNARDAMPSGGELRIRASHEAGFGPDGGICVEVSDTGPGIPEVIQDRIFEPFFTTKQPGVGTGLGLSTAYVTITEAGGDISVDSTPDSGATFLVRLAAAPDGAAPDVPERGRLQDQHPYTNGYILVVEDEESIARMAHQALHSQGYRTLSASTGLEALEAVRDHRERISAVTLDFVLPELSGADVFRYLRDFTPEIPILAISGRQDLIEDLPQATPLLAKPFTNEEFLHALAALLRPEE